MDRPGVCHTEWSKSKREKAVYQCIYVKSRKMVQINLFSEQEQRCRHREWTHGHRVREGEWDELGDLD